MRVLSSVIRERPNWREKIKDPALVKKWKQEVLDQQEAECPVRRLAKRAVNALQR